MTEDQYNYVDKLRKDFYKKGMGSRLCKAELRRPRYNTLIFGFDVDAGVKSMSVYNKKTKERYNY